MAAQLFAVAIFVVMFVLVISEKIERPIVTLAAVLSMFIDSITVILFLAAVTIELSGLLKFNPVPMILSEIFCANLGGSATMCGDPPNIIIGTSLGYSFSDFLTNTGLIAGVSLVIIIGYFFLIFRKDLKTNTADIDFDNMPDPKTAITDKKVCCKLSDFRTGCCIADHACTDRTYGCRNRCNYCSADPDYCTGAYRRNALKGRLQNTFVFHRLVYCSRWSGADKGAGSRC